MKGGALRYIYIPERVLNSINSLIHNLYRRHIDVDLEAIFRVNSRDVQSNTSTSIKRLDLDQFLPFLKQSTVFKK